MSNYPAGALNDPRAPWNQREVFIHRIPCGDCLGTGTYEPEDQGEPPETCWDCKGKGVIEEECEEHCPEHCTCRWCAYDG